MGKYNRFVIVCKLIASFVVNFFAGFLSETREISATKPLGYQKKKLKETGTPAGARQKEQTLDRI